MRIPSGFLLADYANEVVLFFRLPIIPLFFFLVIPSVRKMLHKHCFQFLWWKFDPSSKKGTFTVWELELISLSGFAIFLRVACNLCFVKLRIQTIFWTFYFYESLVGAYFSLSIFFFSFRVLNLNNAGDNTVEKERDAWIEVDRVNSCHLPFFKMYSWIFFFYIWIGIQDWDLQWLSSSLDLSSL